MAKTFEDILNERLKAKILRDLEREQAAGIVNNIGGPMPVTLKDQMAQVAPSGSDEDDYMVAIRRKNLLNDKGEPDGWDKWVRRIKVKKGDKLPSKQELFEGF